MFLLLVAFWLPVVVVYCLGAGFDPGLTSFLATLSKGFLFSITIYLSFSVGSSFKGWVMVDPVGFFVIAVEAVLSLYLSSVDLVVP